jgi:CRP-like cAMP-binding protein
MAQNPCKGAPKPNESSNNGTWGRLASTNFAKEIEKRSKPLVPATDQVLFCEGEAGDRAFLVKSGEAILTVRSLGEVLVNVSVGPGSVLGLSAVVSEKPYGLSAMAGESADIREICAKDFNELLRDCAQFSFEVSQILAAELFSVLKLLSRLAC